MLVIVPFHMYFLIHPFQILQVTDIPYTLNGKRVEVLVKKVREGCVWTLGELSHVTVDKWCPIVLCQPSNAFKSGVLAILLRYWREIACGE